MYVTHVLCCLFLEYFLYLAWRTANCTNWTLFYALATILSGQLITIVSQPDEQAIAALATTAETVDVTDEQTSVEVIIDEDGLLTASEPKRQRVDDLIGGTDTVGMSVGRFCRISPGLSITAECWRYFSAVSMMEYLFQDNHYFCRTVSVMYSAGLFSSDLFYMHAHNHLH